MLKFGPLPEWAGCSALNSGGRTPNAEARRGRPTRSAGVFPRAGPHCGAAAEGTTRGDGAAAPCRIGDTATHPIGRYLHPVEPCRGDSAGPGARATFNFPAPGAAFRLRTWQAR